MNDWLTDYLGKPWLVGANGPDAFDCWGLLVDIYKKRKNLDLPRYDSLDKLDKLQVAEQIKVSLADDWKLLDIPSDLCIVTLSTLPTRIFHVGCYVEKNKGYVIHTRKKFGCMIEPLDKIILNWRYIKFYGLR